MLRERRGLSCNASFRPGDVRNDLYLTLERGDFERGGKSVQKNIEVTVYVLYADGEILKVGTPLSFRGPSTGPQWGPVTGCHKQPMGSFQCSCFYTMFIGRSSSDLLLPPSPSAGLHQSGFGRASGAGAPLLRALPQQQPPLERGHQAADPHRPLQRVTPALRVPPLLQ